MMFKGAMFAKPTPPSSRPTTATTSILTDQSEYPELTLLEWAEWAATAMWWERLYAGHRPRELGRLAVPPADVNGGAFRLHEAVNNETAGDRDAEAERYVDGTTTDWPSATTQVPAPHVPAPPPPTPEQTFRRQLARRAASTGRAKLGVGRKGGLARQVGLNSPRTGSLCAPGDVPRVPFVRAQVAHVEQGTAVAGAAWDRAGRKQITAEITKHLHGEGPMQKEPRYFSNPTPSVASGRGDTPSGAAANWVLPKHDVDRAALLYEDRASPTFYPSGQSEPHRLRLLLLPPPLCGPRSVLAENPPVRPAGQGCALTISRAHPLRKLTCRCAQTPRTPGAGTNSSP